MRNLILAAVGILVFPTLVFASSRLQGGQHTISQYMGGWGMTETVADVAHGGASLMWEDVEYVFHNTNPLNAGQGYYMHNGPPERYLFFTPHDPDTTGDVLIIDELSGWPEGTYTRP